MSNIKTRLNEIEAKLTPKIQIDCVQILNNGRARVERRASYRKNHQWDLLEAELLSELRERLVKAQEAFKWFEAGSAEKVSWRIRRIN